MRLASYLVSSYRRTELLAMSLYCLLGSRVPEGWELEIVVACPPEDEAALRARGLPDDRHAPRITLRFCRGRGGRTDVGSQNSGAFDASRGEICLHSGDDDLQPPQRLAEVIAAMEGGSLAVGFGCFYFARLPGGELTEWRGPPWDAGSSMAYRRELLEAADGWGEVHRGADNRLKQRLLAVGYDLRSLTHNLPAAGAGAVMTCHGANISKRRPIPEDGLGMGHGPWWIMPVGHYTDAPDLPGRTRTALDWLCGRDADSGSERAGHPR